MDLDAFSAAHRDEWQRLEELLRARPRRLLSAATVSEADELVELYQRAATHLSQVQSLPGADARLVGTLSSLVARARAAVTGTRSPALADAVRFLREDFPAVVYRTRSWWGASALGFLLVSFAVGAWVAGDPAVQLAVASPEETRQLVEEDFEDYYSSDPAQDFAARVFTNNAYVAAQAILFGIFLGLPVVLVLLLNAVNVGVSGGLLAANDRAGLFFGLILPHGLLELTAVFVAAGLGLRLGWTVVDPGGLPRAQALAEQGRALVSGALGLALVLFVSGLVEAFVTPSGLPTAARIGIGVAVELLFLAWVFGPGRRAALAGVTGDLRGGARGDVLPLRAG